MATAEVLLRGRVQTKGLDSSGDVLVYTAYPRHSFQGTGHSRIITITNNHSTDLVLTLHVFMHVILTRSDYSCWQMRCPALYVRHSNTTDIGTLSAFTRDGHSHGSFMCLEFF